jgi:hypothetical protein
MWFLANKDASLLKVVLQRIAFASQPSWISFLRICICSHKAVSFDDVPPERETMEVLCPTFWREIYDAATFRNSLRRSPDTIPYSKTAFQIATAANNVQVVEYLIRSGHHPEPGPESPIRISSQTRSALLLELLLTTNTHPGTVATEAMREVLSTRASTKPFNDHPLWLRIGYSSPFAGYSPPFSNRSTLEIVKKLLNAGCDAISSLSWGGEEYPFIHFIIGTARTQFDAEMVELLIKNGAGPHSMSNIVGNAFNDRPVFISALAHATLFGRDDIVRVLLERGARRFECYPRNVFDSVPLSYSAFLDDSLVKAISALQMAMIKEGWCNIARFIVAIEKWRADGLNFSEND